MVAFRAFWGYSVFSKKNKKRNNVNYSQTTMKKKDGGFKMEDCKRGIQSLIDMVKNGDEQAALILKEIDILLDECEMNMLKKKG